MQPIPQPGLDHGADVVQVLLDPVLQPLWTKHRGRLPGGHRLCAPGTVHTPGTVVTRP